MTILDYALVFILTVLAGGWSIAAGVIFGLNPVGVYIAAVLSCLTLTALMLGPGGRLFDSARERYFPDAMDKATEGRVRKILDRWGIPGLATVGGLVLGPTITGSAVLILGLDRKQFARWWVASILVGFAILTGFWVLVAT